MRFLGAPCLGRALTPEEEAEADAMAEEIRALVRLFGVRAFTGSRFPMRRRVMLRRLTGPPHRSHRH